MHITLALRSNSLTKAWSLDPWQAPFEAERILALQRPGSDEDRLPCLGGSGGLQNPSPRMSPALDASSLLQSMFRNPALRLLRPIDSSLPLIARHYFFKPPPASFLSLIPIPPFYLFFLPCNPIPRYPIQIRHTTLHRQCPKPKRKTHKDINSPTYDISTI